MMQEISDLTEINSSVVKNKVSTGLCNHINTEVHL